MKLIFRAKFCLKYTNWYICEVKKSELTKNYIIEKTATVFNKRGFIGTSLAEISQATGLTKGGIYGNFKDKLSLSIAVFEYNWASQRKPILQKINESSSAKEKLLVFTHHYRRHYKEVFENGGCALLNTATDSDDIEPALQTCAKKALLSWKHEIENIIKLGLEKREFKNVHPEEFSSLFIALIEGSILLAKTTSKPKFLIQNLDFLEKQIKNI